MSLIISRFLLKYGILETPEQLGQKWSKSIKIVAAAEWQWREASILIRLLFHLILFVFQSYMLKRKHVANEGQHGEGHEGGDQDQEMSTKRLLS